MSVHDWLEVPMQVRMKLREVFQIPKSQGSLVEGNVVKSDGTTYKDLEAITVEKMQAFMETEETDFITLFHASINKIQTSLEAENPAPVKPDPTVVILEEWAVNLHRMKNQAENLDLIEHFQTLISKFLPDVQKKDREPKGASDANTTHADGRGAKSSKTKPKGNEAGSSKAEGHS